MSRIYTFHVYTKCPVCTHFPKDSKYPVYIHFTRISMSSIIIHNLHVFQVSSIYTFSQGFQVSSVYTFHKDFNVQYNYTQFTCIPSFQYIHIFIRTCVQYIHISQGFQGSCLNTFSQGFQISRIYTFHKDSKCPVYAPFTRISSTFIHFSPQECFLLLALISQQLTIIVHIKSFYSGHAQKAIYIHSCQSSIFINLKTFFSKCIPV